MRAAAAVMPPDHPQRMLLNDEVHARPSQLLSAPMRITSLSMIAEASERERQWRQVHDLAVAHGAPPPPVGATHYSADLGAFRLKWERHTEFARYEFMVAGACDDPFTDTAIARVPADWVAALPGVLLVAVHGALLGAGEVGADADATAARFFEGNYLVGAEVAGGAAMGFTDFRIHADGFSRLLVEDRAMTPRQAGRTVQRLIEIDTYRIMALLALPLARQLGPVLDRWERELAEITAALATARDADEPDLLDRLTRLEAEIESRQAENSYRFSASVAYYDLVRRRTAELREGRIEGLQTYQEFTERRLAPAMATCATAATRQEALSQRVARVSQLLSTRVDLTRERQNQALLESMDRRARLQLRLQETVEGLSIAAVTYYIVGIVGYAAKGAHAAGAGIDPEIVVAAAVPVVALLLYAALRKLRRVIASEGVR